MKRLFVSCLLVFFVVGAFADDDSLAPEKIRNWIETRIGERQLQQAWEADAAGHDDLSMAFFTERNAWLEARGWHVVDYESTGQRILDAYHALQQQDAINAHAAERDAERDYIRNNSRFNEEQKRQMLDSLDKLHDAQRDQVNRSRQDRDVVRPWRATLAGLLDWLSGKADKPPQPGD